VTIESGDTGAFGTKLAAGRAAKALSPVWGFRSRPVAMDLGTPSDQLILMLYGTGIRNYQTLPQVTIGGTPATVLGAAAQSQYAGLDQVNVLVPNSLKGAGDVDLLLKVDGNAANTVRIRIL
jgi:uncharacterized protein (TIGR03437 family)